MLARRSNWLPGIFNDFFGNEWIEKSSAASPAVNIIENEKEFKIEVAAPGLTKEDFRVELLDNNHLLVSMEKKTESKEEEDGDKYLRREFSYVNFRQSLLLPENVQKEKIEATVKDGVLMVYIPKKEEVEQVIQTKQIEVK